MARKKKEEAIDVAEAKPIEEQKPDELLNAVTERMIPAALRDVATVTEMESNNPPFRRHRASIPMNEIARVAYGKLAEELKDRGDYPAWELISDRARQSCIDAVEHVLKTKELRTRFEQVVLEVMNG